LNPILVIGGGISGITAAVELAETGKDVILIEKTAYLGGNVVKFNSYFPKLCPPACGMEINFRRIRNNPKIKILTHTELMSLEGEQGNMRARLRTMPQMVNDFCTACGDCVDSCPVERSDAFNYNFGLTKAIYLPHALSFPQKYEIDENTCIGAACGKCVDKCSYDAIRLDAEENEQELQIHSTINASGWKNYDAANIEELNYNSSPDIVTNVEFERLLAKTGPGKGKLLRPSDKSIPKYVAFVQCAGSRDRNHLKYCSSVCCSASLKHALNIVEMLPDTKVSVFYIDLRVSGRNEDFLSRVEKEERINLIKGKVAKVTQDPVSGKHNIVFEDILKGLKITEAFDMVVLATGMVPGNELPGLNINEDGFAVAEQMNGMYSAGCATKPMDVSASVKEATAAAVNAMKN